MRLFVVSFLFVIFVTLSQAYPYKPKYYGSHHVPTIDIEVFIEQKPKYHEPKYQQYPIYEQVKEQDHQNYGKVYQQNPPPIYQQVKEQQPDYVQIYQPSPVEQIYEQVKQQDYVKVHQQYPSPIYEQVRDNHQEYERDHQQYPSPVYEQVKEQQPDYQNVHQPGQIVKIYRTIYNYEPPIMVHENSYDQTNNPSNYLVNQYYQTIPAPVYNSGYAEQEKDYSEEKEAYPYGGVAGNQVGYARNDVDENSLNSYDTNGNRM